MQQVGFIMSMQRKFLEIIKQFEIHVVGEEVKELNAKNVSFEWQFISHLKENIFIVVRGIGRPSPMRIHIWSPADRVTKWC